MKQIRLFWNQNPEANVIGYSIVVNNIVGSIDRNSPLEFFQVFTEGEFVHAEIRALASNGPESDPATLDFQVPTDNNKPSVPTGFGWEVVAP